MFFGGQKAVKVKEKDRTEEKTRGRNLPATHLLYGYQLVVSGSSGSKLIPQSSA